MLGGVKGSRVLWSRHWRGASALLLTLVVSATASCNGKSTHDGGDDDSGPSSAGTGGGTSQVTPVAANSFGQSFADAFCGAIGPCCQRGGYDFSGASCGATLKAYVDAVVSAYATDAGVAFDENVAATCVEQYRKFAAACTDRSLQNELDAACEHVFRGTVAQGGACTIDAACADIPGFEYVRCDAGVCKPDTDFTSLGPHAKLGEPCIQTCETDATGFGCSGGRSSNTTPPATNAACFQNDGLYCSNTYVCAALPKIGEPCPGYLCVADAYCDGSVCTTAKATGPCASIDECLSTSYCDDTTQMCIPLKTNGTHCNYDSECKSVNCEGDVCRDWSAASVGHCAGVIDD